MGHDSCHVISILRYEVKVDATEPCSYSSSSWFSHALHVLTYLSTGVQLADVVMLVGTVDVVFGSVDLYMGHDPWGLHLSTTV